MKPYVKCKTDGCPNKYYSSGYCGKHYRAALAAGTIVKKRDRPAKGLCECGQLATIERICEDCHALEKAKPVKPPEYVEPETWPKPIEKPFNNVTTYTLSPEELERYRNMPPPDRNGYTFQPAWTKQQARGAYDRLRSR